MAYTPFAGEPRKCIGFSVAKLKAKLVLVYLVYRYYFVNASKKLIVYNPEFLVIRPLNFYIRAYRKTSWPSKTGSNTSL